MRVCILLATVLWSIPDPDRQSFRNTLWESSHAWECFFHEIPLKQSTAKIPLHSSSTPTLVCFSKFDEKGKSLMIRKHFAGIVASTRALGIPAQAFAGAVVSVSAVKSNTGDIA